MGLFLSDTAVTDYEGRRPGGGGERDVRRPFFHGLLDRGVAIAPGAYEILFPGLAHGAAELVLFTAEAPPPRPLPP